MEYFRFVYISVMVTFQFWWYIIFLGHLSFDDIWVKHNHFKAFFLLRRLRLIDWNSLGAKSLEMHNNVGRWRWGYHYNLFPSYKRWTQDQLSMGRHPHKDLKWNELGLGPIQACLKAFLGFLVKTKMKAYTKLTVVDFFLFSTNLFF